MLDEGVFAFIRSPHWPLFFPEMKNVNSAFKKFALYISINPSHVSNQQKYQMHRLRSPP